jgi:hypothetical protein
MVAEQRRCAARLIWFFYKLSFILNKEDAFSMTWFIGHSVGITFLWQPSLLME